MCDRCPAEVEQGRAHRPWAVMLISVGEGNAKHVVLCPECFRALRVWLLSSEVRHA